MSDLMEKYNLRMGVGNIIVENAVTGRIVVRKGEDMLSLEVEEAELVIKMLQTLTRAE